MKRLHETSIEVEIPFHDVDALGVVWHGHYYKYLELARTRMLTSLHLDGDELLETGHRLFVVESRCRYTFPLRYRDRAKVTAWMNEYENRLLISYEIQNITYGRRTARAHTVLAVTDAEGNLLFEMPAVMVERIVADA